MPEPRILSWIRNAPCACLRTQTLALHRRTDKHRPPTHGPTAVSNSRTAQLPHIRCAVHFTIPGTTEPSPTSIPYRTVATCLSPATPDPQHMCFIQNWALGSFLNKNPIVLQPLHANVNNSSSKFKNKPFNGCALSGTGVGVHFHVSNVVDLISAPAAWNFFKHFYF